MCQYTVSEAARIGPDEIGSPPALEYDELNSRFLFAIKYSWIFCLPQFPLPFCLTDLVTCISPHNPSPSIPLPEVGMWLPLRWPKGYICQILFNTVTLRVLAGERRTISRRRRRKRRRRKRKRRRRRRGRRRRRR